MVGQLTTWIATANSNKSVGGGLDLSMIEYGTLRKASGSESKNPVVDLWTHTTEGLTGGARATTPEVTANVIPSVVDPVLQSNADPPDRRPGLQALKTVHEVHIELAVEEVDHVERVIHVQTVGHVEGQLGI